MHRNRTPAYLVEVDSPIECNPYTSSTFFDSLKDTVSFETVKTYLFVSKMSKSKLVYMAAMPTVGFALLFVVCFLKQFVFMRIF